MSEEEKVALEFIKINNKHRYCDKDDVDFLINLIENQQEKINNLKEIEKTHKEENGKLRIELEQYKLLEANIDKANRIIAENKFDEGLYGLLMQEKEKSKELNEALERSSGENSDLKYQIYHKQQMIDELTKNEENLKIELGKEKEKNKELEKQINFNKKTVEIAQTQILEYSQGYKDGLNKETTATAIVARELELNFIRQEIKHKYISKAKIKDMMKYREFELQQEYKEFEEDIEWRTYKKILEV